MSVPPGPRWPRPVQTLAWTTRPLPFMERCARRYGDAFTVRIANEGTWVMVSHPDAVKQVFTGDPRLLHAGEGNVILRPLLGSHSVLLLDEDEHLRHRKILLPPLHGARLARHVETMRAVAEREVATWPADGRLRLAARMRDLTLEVIIRTVFGVSDNERYAELHRRLRTTLDTLMSSTSTIAMLAVLGPTRVDRVPFLRRVLAPVDEFLYEEIARRRAERGLAERDDVMSLLLQAHHEDGSPMSDEELRDELMTLLVAGHETTATAVGWAFERLMRQPATLARLADEVAAGEDAYLDAVIKETLRLRPVIAIVARRLAAPMEIGGYDLPAGVTVTPSIYLMHRRPDIYRDPAAFRPERFLEREPGTYTWIPFGGGVRRCLGAAFAIQEMKIVLAAVVAHAALRPVEPRGERAVRRAITLVPERGAEALVSTSAAPKRGAKATVGGA